MSLRLAPLQSKVMREVVKNIQIEIVTETHVVVKTVIGADILSKIDTNTAIKKGSRTNRFGSRDRNENRTRQKDSSTVKDRNSDRDRYEDGQGLKFRAL